MSWNVSTNGMQYGSPFYCVLKESLHFWERRDNTDIQSFHPVFTIWAPPESDRRETEKETEMDYKKNKDKYVKYRSRKFQTSVCLVQDLSLAAPELNFFFCCLSLWRPAVQKWHHYVFNLSLPFIFSLSGHFVLSWLNHSYLKTF